MHYPEGVFLRRLFASISFVCIFLNTAQATIVIPPNFDALVSSASLIFVGEVIDVRSEWIHTREGRAIITKVSFKVDSTWKGAVGAITRLDFMGGTVGDVTMEVVGMPQFLVGQRDVLFVSADAKAVSPLVGFYHGRLRIESAANGADLLRTYDGRVLSATADFAANGARLSSSVPMRLADLESAVRTRVLRGQGR